MRRCAVHGTEFEYWEGCPDCREAEEREEVDRAALLEAMERDREATIAASERATLAREESDYRLANPGDYMCPACMYVTLRRTATRCPKCHATIATAFWVPILEREQREAETRERERARAAEEWARGEPERRKKKQAEHEARIAEAQQAARRASLRSIAVTTAVIAWPIAFFMSVKTVMPAYLESSYSANAFLDLVPMVLIFAIPSLVSWAILRVGK